MLIINIQNITRSLIYLFTLFIGIGAAAQSPSMIFASMNQLTYTGAWGRFATVNDAENNSSSIDTGNLPLRDLTFQYDSETNWFSFGTFWNAKDSSGGSTPYNTNEGFIQMYDMSGIRTTQVDYNYSGTNNENLIFSLDGANALGADFDQDNKTTNNNQWCRAGVGTDNSSGSNGGDSGDWLSYSLDMTFVGSLSGDNKKYFVTDTSGTMSIIFEHDDPRAVSLNGFYRIDLTITDENSWAIANNSPELKDTNNVITVPEPSAFALLLAMGASAMVFIRRKPRSCL